MTGELAPVDYAGLLEAVKAEIALTRVRAARAVNTELIGMYSRAALVRLTRGAGGTDTRVSDASRSVDRVDETWAASKLTSVIEADPRSYDRDDPR